MTEEGRTAYDQQVKTLPQSKRAKATKDFLANHPEYIAETVYSTTKKDGTYSFKFKNTEKDPTLVDNIVNHMYMQVFDKNDKLVNAYSSFTTPEFRNYNTNDSFRPQNKPS